MSREPEVSVKAFQKHMRFLRERYGRQVVLNLLGTGVTGRSQGEAALSHLFQVRQKQGKGGRGMFVPSCSYWSFILGVEGKLFGFSYVSLTSLSVI